MELVFNTVALEIFLLRVNFSIQLDLPNMENFLYYGSMENYLYYLHLLCVTSTCFYKYDETH